jgi:D-alanyl-D-alanine carboxypeptidase
MGKWLLANAARYGFELSFPAGNRQQVKWEPWHWRWVGTSAAAAGAEPARRTFALARAKFPANPGVE